MIIEQAAIKYAESYGRTVDAVARERRFLLTTNPHFSPADYCGDEYIRPDCVMLSRPPRRTVKYDCGSLCRKPCQAGVFTASLRKLVKNAD